MINEKEYVSYIGNEVPSNFKRLKNIALIELRKITGNIPTNEYLLNAFKNALAEEIYYLDMNGDSFLIGGMGASLGSYKEGSVKDNSNGIERISPVAYDILVSNGLVLYAL